MHPSGPPTVTPLIHAITARSGRVSGQRAVIEFSPKLVSIERLCAGVVLRTDGGEVLPGCALDKRKLSHAFGEPGVALFEIANVLCESLALHWRSSGSAEGWVPPFEGARIARLSDFSAKNAASAIAQINDHHSTLNTLLAGYEITEISRATNIVERVRGAVKRDANAKHLEKRFNRVLTIGAGAAPMRIDFLGQNFACYFIQIVRSYRHGEMNTERALGKIYELELLRKFVSKPKKSLGLLDEERPQSFELVMVGDHNNAIQKRIVNQIEAMADRSEVRARLLPDPVTAAAHVSDRERLAA